MCAEEVKSREEKASRSQCELRRVLEGLAVQLSSPSRFVDAQEENIRERIRELQHECKEKSIVSNMIISIKGFSRLCVLLIRSKRGCFNKD
jgi:hypothetical protein